MGNVLKLWSNTDRKIPHNWVQICWGRNPIKQWLNRDTSKLSWNHSNIQRSRAFVMNAMCTQINKNMWVVNWFQIRLSLYTHWFIEKVGVFLILPPGSSKVRCFQISHTVVLNQKHISEPPCCTAWHIHSLQWTWPLLFLQKLMPNTH